MDYPGRLNLTARVLKEGERRIRVKGVVTKESEIKVMCHEPKKVPSI